MKGRYLAFLVCRELFRQLASQVLEMKKASKEKRHGMFSIRVQNSWTNTLTHVSWSLPVRRSLGEGGKFGASLGLGIWSLELPYTTGVEGKQRGEGIIFRRGNACS